MKQIKNSEYEEFQKYLHDKNTGRILTPDGLQFICQANDYDPEKSENTFLRCCRKYFNKKSEEHI